MKYLIVVAVVFAVNLLPAFGPPTWLLLVFAKIRWNLNPVPLVALGGVAAASGRYVLARGARRLGNRLPQRMRTNLEAAQAAIQKKRRAVVLTIGLFIVSPLPSAQLFVAAGLLKMNLEWLTIAFFAGRIVSYSFYIGVATIAEKQLGDVLVQAWGSWWSILIQVVLVIVVAAVPLLHWKVGDEESGTTPLTPHSAG